MRSRSWARGAAMALVCTICLSLAACATSINQVMTDPSRYRNQQAKISGRVVDSYALGPQGAYLLDDRTGQIWVVSDRGVPRRGAWVTVYGRVREGFSLGMLGDRVRLPRGVGSGVVLIEDHHRAQF